MQGDFELLRPPCVIQIARIYFSIEYVLGNFTMQSFDSKKSSCLQWIDLTAQNQWFIITFMMGPLWKCNQAKAYLVPLWYIAWAITMSWNSFSRSVITFVQLCFHTIFCQTIIIRFLYTYKVSAWNLRWKLSFPHFLIVT